MIDISALSSLGSATPSLPALRYELILTWSLSKCILANLSSSRSLVATFLFYMWILGLNASYLILDSIQALATRQ